MKTRTVVTVGVAIAVTGLIATIDLLVGPASLDEGTLAAAPHSEGGVDNRGVQHVAGQSVCAIGEQVADTDLALIVANASAAGAAEQPGSGDGASEGSADGPDGPVPGVAEAQLRYQRAGDVRTEPRRSVAADDVFAVVPNDVAVVRWWDSPVVAHREWVLEAGDLPAGIVTGACESAVSDTWTIPGLVTSGGAEARVAITNPYRGDASVAIRFLTPEGPEAPLALQNVSVPARDTVEIIINEVLPERDDLAMIIDVGAGRVSVEGLQLVRSAIGGIDGASLLKAAPQAAEQWHVPWVANTGTATSWLWVVNPSDREAILELSALTPDGGTLLDDADEITVAPGEMQRIELSQYWPDNTDVAALSVRADGTPIVVSAGTQIEASAVEDTALIVQPAVDALDHLWVVPFTTGHDRDEQLHIVNPGSEHAVVDVLLRTAQGDLRPAALQDVHVAPGSRTALDLSGALPTVADPDDEAADDDGGPNGQAGTNGQAAADDNADATDSADEADSANDVGASEDGGEAAEGATTGVFGDDDHIAAAFVVARGGPVVVARVGADVDGHRRLVAVPGTPSRVWFSPGTIPVHGMITGLTQRLGTIFGHAFEGPIAASEPRARLMAPYSVGTPFTGTARGTLQPQVAAIPGAPVETALVDDAGDDELDGDADGDGESDEPDAVGPNGAGS